jgi:hydroxymethylbilane synthase
MSTLRIGTRGSVLALTQTELVRAELQRQHPDLTVEIERITTKGDTILDRPLSALGARGLFVTEIEDAMRSGRIDCAVHSAKDLPSELPHDMTITAFLQRADARDMLVARIDGPSVTDLPAGARVGTSSPRRICQLRAVRPDLLVLDVRGNVDTRLRKLAAGEYDALVLAAAGLDRLQIQPEHAARLDTELMLPAVGQGALAIESRANDMRVAALFTPLNHTKTSIEVRVERAFLATLGGGCSAAVGAYATVLGSHVTLTGMIGSLEGHRVRDTRTAGINASLDIACEMARTLAKDLLREGKQWLTVAPAPIGTARGSA